MTDEIVLLRRASDVRRYGRSAFMHLNARVVVPGTDVDVSAWQMSVDASSLACGCIESAIAFVFAVVVEAAMVVGGGVELSGQSWQLALGLVGLPLLAALCGKVAGLWRARHRLLRLAAEIERAEVRP